MKSVKKETLISVAAYLLVGGASIGLAAYVSSYFLTPSHSQNPARPASGNNAVPGAEEEDSTDPESTAASAADIQSVMEPYIYDPKGRRDPFKPFVQLTPSTATGSGGEVLGPLLPLQRFDLEEINLIGIIWDVNEPRAMFRDPNNEVHVLGKDERIGRNNGYIAVIREGEVVIVETVRKKGTIEYFPRVMKLAR